MNNSMKHSFVRYRDLIYTVRDLIVQIFESNKKIVFSLLYKRNSAARNNFKIAKIMIKRRAFFDAIFRLHLANLMYPNHHAVLYNLANLYIMSGNVKKAVIYIKRLAAISNEKYIDKIEAMLNQIEIIYGDAIKPNVKQSQ